MKKKKSVTSFILKIIENFGYFLSRIGNYVDNWAWDKSLRMKEIRIEIKDEARLSMENVNTPFGKEREDLIVLHQRIIEEEKG